jgi:rhodanese-related sulfurtransferase
MQDISVQELRQKLQSGEKFVLIDVRESYENEDFNLGGVLMPLATLPVRLDDLEEHQDEEIILYCRSGVRSNTAKYFLQERGFKKVRNLLGGTLAWMDAYGRETPE